MSKFFYTNPTNTDVLLKAGIEAAKTGQQAKARDILLHVIELDQKNVAAWLWLSGVTEDTEEKRTCLENILTINPHHALARKGLTLLPAPKQPRGPAPSARPKLRSITSSYKLLTPRPLGPENQTSETATSASVSPSTRIKRPASIASAVLDSDFAARQTYRSDEDASQHNDIFSNEYLCPYCAAVTKPKDKKCKSCQGGLWYFIPHLKKPSKLFLFLMGSQTFSLLGVILMTLGFFLASLDGETISMGLALIFVGVSFYHIIVFLGLYRRWRIIYYLYLAQAIISLGLLLIFAFALRAEANISIYCARSLIFLGVIQLFMFFNLGEDFTFDKYRIRLQLDSDVKGGVAAMDKGNRYAKKKMWALAALHFRRAAYQMAELIEPQLSLAVAYNNLKMYDKMAIPLAKAKELSPNDLRVQKLTTLMKQKLKG